MQQYSICYKVYSPFNYSVSPGNPFLTKEQTPPPKKKINMIKTRLSKVSKNDDILNILHNNCCQILVTASSPVS